VRAVLVAAILLALIGCRSEEPATVEPEPTGIRSYEGRVIRGWLLSLERMDYSQAAYYFARGALIDQGHPYRLRTESEAAAFNASLPCRADLVRLKNQGHGHVLATFSLKEGPGGECTGTVKVRYTIVKGKFTEWRQRPNQQERQLSPPRSAAALRDGCRGGAGPRVRAVSRPASPARAAAPPWDCPRRPALPS
jgi:hypothetical protein